MGTLTASPLYVGLGALLALLLGLLVSRQRGLHKVGIGDGGVPELQRAMRAHGNFVEYAPIVLLALVALEAIGEAKWLIHLLGIAFILARLAHAWGISASSGESPGRLVGASVTFLILLLSGALLILGFLGVRI